MKNKRFLIVGLGVLGNSIACTLSEDGAEVIVVDQSPELIEEIKDRVDVAAVGDANDRKMLEQMGATSVDAAIVCIGENFESAVLATAHLLDLKVKHVAVRANSDIAASILKRLGAHQVFFVEKAMGQVIAHQLSHTAVLHEMDLGGGYRVVQIQAPQEMWGKNLMELALPKRFNIQIIAVRPGSHDQAMKSPTPETLIQRDDTILISGHKSELTRFLER